MPSFLNSRVKKLLDKAMPLIIKSCTIVKAPSGKYYLSILVEEVSAIEPIKSVTDKVLGLDYAINGLPVVKLALYVVLKTMSCNYLIGFIGALIRIATMSKTAIGMQL
jgi:hypothetical protein